MSVYRLECDHINQPLTGGQIAGDKAYCGRCHDYRMITEVNAEFRVRCGTCHWGTRCGAAEINARGVADRHSRKFPTHVVRVESGSRVLQVSNPARAGEKIRFPDPLDSTPPF